MNRADRWVVGAALVFIATLYVWIYAGPAGGPGVLAEVTVAGRPAEPIDLHRDGPLAVEGRLGVSRLLVRDGRVRFTDSPCRGKQCIGSGWLAREGDFAACLPNGVAVEVRGPRGGLDAISY
jgi:hypothetical protein